MLNLKVVSDKQVLQRADRADVCIGRTQTILNEDTQEKTIVDFWYQNGRLHHVSSRPYLED